MDIFGFKTRHLTYLNFRKDAEVLMEGQFLVRQIYDDEITYNLIAAAVEKLRKYCKNLLKVKRK